jgi:hypothetical protein
MVLALPFRANCPTNADRFRQVFHDYRDRWCDLRMSDEVPADQRVCQDHHDRADNDPSQREFKGYLADVFFVAGQMTLIFLKAFG